LPDSRDNEKTLIETTWKADGFVTNTFLFDFCYYHH